MVRISEYFDIKGNQASFDFVDVHLEKDTRLFIDPSVIAATEGDWEDECVSAIQSYFQKVLNCIHAGDENHARTLLSRLGEDNSTRLGYSARNKGSGVGSLLAEKFYDELSSSRALKSGLISDIEDTALLIEGVRTDRISDVVTNIIRQQLIQYTQETSKFYGIPLTSAATSSCWNAAAMQWEQPAYHDVIVADGYPPVLLVPKSIVRRSLFMDPGEYYRYYVLEFFQEDELARQSPLVYTLKSGERRVNKGDVEKKYRTKHWNGGAPGLEKRINLDATERRPDLLNQFKEHKEANPPGAISSESLAEVTGIEQPDLLAMLQTVVDLPPGRDHADNYEKAIEALLSSLLYPNLVHPKRQTRIHQGRKRIDITYTNMAREGLFEWLSSHYPSGKIMVECKNYSRKLGNPEFDQISGRFSPSRGQYGILVYRGFSDKNEVMKSMRDTAQDRRGYITALDDGDLRTLVDEKLETGSCSGLEGLLASRFDDLIN